jgi:hypothetical protein
MVATLRDEINTKLTQISNIYPENCITILDTESEYGSSTEINNNYYMYELDINTGYIDADAEKGISQYTLAMYQL